MRSCDSFFGSSEFYISIYGPKIWNAGTKVEIDVICWPYYSLSLTLIGDFDPFLFRRHYKGLLDQKYVTKTRTKEKERRKNTLKPPNDGLSNSKWNCSWNVALLQTVNVEFLKTGYNSPHIKVHECVPLSGAFPNAHSCFPPFNKREQKKLCHSD